MCDLFQPLDLALFSPLKSKMQTLSSAWHHDNPTEVLNKYTMMPHVAWPASEDVFGNRELIKTAFRISGIYPWDKSAVHWEKLEAGSLYTDKTSEMAAELLPAVEENAAGVMDARMEDAMEVTEASMEVAAGVRDEFAGEVGMMEEGGVMEVSDMMDVSGVLDEAGVMDKADMMDEAYTAEVGIPSDWAHNVADPSIMGLVDPSIASLTTPEISPPLAEAEARASNHLTGSDIANFVPTEHSSRVDIIPEINKEEMVHLFKR